jgi:hypothetical protein
MSCVSLATPGTEACDAVGGALRPKWREWPAGALGGSYPSGSPLACCCRHERFHSEAAHKDASYFRRVAHFDVVLER